jgi:hypothetical protein
LQIKRLTLAAILGLFALPAFAEKQWLSPEAFEAQVSGKAMQVFDQSGDLFGTDSYLPNAGCRFDACCQRTPVETRCAVM